MAGPIPEFILCDTLWDFADQGPYPSQTAFAAAVLNHHRRAHEYAPEIRPEESWRPSSLAIRSPRIKVEFFCDGPEGGVSWHEIELGSEDGASFTAGELLFKLHNGIIERVRGNGHRYFEGLELRGVTESGVPVYDLRLGS